MAQSSSPRSFYNEDYDPFEMRGEDEIVASQVQPVQPSYSQATKAPTSQSTTPQREIYTTSREISALDTPAPAHYQQHHHHHKFHLGEQVQEKASKNLRKRYGGRWAFYDGLHRVFLPRPAPNTDPETVAQQQAYHYDEAKTWDEPKGQVVKSAEGMYEYRNEFYQIDHKFLDTAVYLSPTNYVPRRLVVQATGHVLREVEGGADTGDWIRTRISGNVPVVLKISEWALRPLDKDRWWNKLDGGLRMLAVSFPLQVMLAMPGFSDAFDDAEVADSYTDHPGYHCKSLSHSHTISSHPLHH